jgi:hypothetical protein
MKTQNRLALLVAGLLLKTEAAWARLAHDYDQSVKAKQLKFGDVVELTSKELFRELFNEK